MKRSGTVVIVGVGLIGGSIGLAARSMGVADRVVGVDLDAAQLGRAVQRGAIDDAVPNLAQAVQDAEIVILATPVPATVPLILAASRAGRGSVAITDVGSTKARIVAEAEADPHARACFVGSHPIAGSERQGVQHARADLFRGKYVAITGTSQTPVDRLDQVRDFWSSLGAWPILVDPHAHDAQMALTSHLPHALAAALAALVPPESLRLAAGAYRDGTRVAGAEASLWAGIFLDNQLPLLAALGQFESTLGTFRAALEARDRAALIDWWEVGRRNRQHYTGQDAS